MFCIAHALGHAKQWNYNMWEYEHCFLYESMSETNVASVTTTRMKFNLCVRRRCRCVFENCVCVRDRERGALGITHFIIIMYFKRIKTICSALLGHKTFCSNITVCSLFQSKTLHTHTQCVQLEPVLGKFCSCPKNILNTSKNELC